MDLVIVLVHCKLRCLIELLLTSQPCSRPRRYGGNPVCSAGGRAVLRVVDKEQRQQHCAKVGDHLLTRLRALQAKHDIIGDVRGSGLMLGVEFVKDRNTKVGVTHWCCTRLLF